MGSGLSGLYNNTRGSSGGGGSGKSSGPVNGKDYNSAGSDSVKTVNSVYKTNAHSLSPDGQPNSVTQNYKNGTLHSERYYNSDGKAYLDIDYTNHGNPKQHPDVPHEHSITFDENGDMHRSGKDGKI